MISELIIGLIATIILLGIFNFIFWFLGYIGEKIFNHGDRFESGFHLIVYLFLSLVVGGFSYFFGKYLLGVFLG